MSAAACGTCSTQRESCRNFSKSTQACVESFQTCWWHIGRGITQQLAKPRAAVQSTSDHIMLQHRQRCSKRSQHQVVNAGVRGDRVGACALEFSTILQETGWRQRARKSPTVTVQSDSPASLGMSQRLGVRNMKHLQERHFVASELPRNQARKNKKSTPASISVTSEQKRWISTNGMNCRALSLFFVAQNTESKASVPSVSRRKQHRLHHV